MAATVAASGESALELLAQRTFDLMLLDVEMPGMDGFQVAERVQQSWPALLAKTLVLSSMGHSGDASRCRALHLGAYLIKPVKHSELHQAVQALFRRQAGAGGSCEAAAAALSPAAGGGPERTPAALRILLAEDNLVNQMVARRLLEKAGHSVAVADTGRRAVEAFAGGPFDVILMDVQMPEMDGFEATAAIREREAAMPPGARTRTPILALTAHAMAGTRERCLDAGMDGYVSKPIAMAELLKAIAEACLAAPADVV